MRYTGHLDLFKTWERTLRRAKLPLAYSQGFHPNPRMSLASALPLGMTADNELLDVWLEKPIELEIIHRSIERVLPSGIILKSVEEVQHHAPALQTQVIAAEYEATLLEPPYDLDLRVKKLLEAKQLLRSRRGKSYDLRVLVEELNYLSDNQEKPPRLFMRLTAKEGATGRPEEVLTALGLSPYMARICRKCLIFHQDNPPLHN